MRKVIVTSVMTACALVFMAPQAAMAQLPDIATITEKYADTVVNISGRSEPGEAPKMPGMPKAPQGQNPFGGTPFEDLFQEFFRSLPQQQMRPTQSLGSGVIISADGFVVTNNHVVEMADVVTVKLTDESEYQAEVIGTDPKNDLALLKIDAGRTLPFAKLGDSDALRVGEWVVAIGNPFGLGGTVTAGIISARGRHIGQGPYDDFLQTDAAINPGNSGGPLFDMDGNVVGINTAIFTRSGGSNGIGFAIPSNTAKTIVEQIKEYGRPIRGWLGVKIQTVTPDMADALGIEKGKGALVTQVLDASPAQRAGLKTGDLILEFNGRDIQKMVELPKFVAETPVGKTVPINIYRDGEYLVLQASIDELVEEGAEPVLPKDPQFTETLGMNLMDLTDTLRAKFGIDSGQKGVLAFDVAAGSPASRAGILPGDVIVRVNRATVNSAAAAKKAIAADKGKSVLLLMNRHGNNTFVPVRREAKK